MNRLKEALHNDPNPLETQEWLESIKAVIDIAGPERAHQLLEGVAEQIHRTGTNLPFSPITEYVNTIPTADEA
ncbi:hypothetical protein, partial [Xylella fastidiosa]